MVLSAGRFRWTMVRLLVRRRVCVTWISQAGHPTTRATLARGSNGGGPAKCTVCGTRNRFSVSRHKPKDWYILAALGALQHILSSLSTMGCRGNAVAISGLFSEIIHAGLTRQILKALLA